MRPPQYTFDNGAWTLGAGAVPGTNFNRGRNKLFFFFSQDVLSRTDPGGRNERRMPTELERRGDFSQSFNAAGQLLFIAIRSWQENCSVTAGGPAASRQCHPANRINRRRSGC